MSQTANMCVLNRPPCNSSSSAWPWVSRVPSTVSRQSHCSKSLQGAVLLFDRYASSRGDLHCCARPSVLPKGSHTCTGTGYAGTKQSLLT